MAINPTLGTRTAVTVTGYSTMASATYVVSDTITPNTNKPVDVIIEVNAGTTNTPSGNNKQVKVFAKTSLDAINFTSGPESGISTTHEENLKYLGVVGVKAAQVVTSCTGTSGQNTIVLTSATGIAPGDLVTGTGIGAGARVISIVTLTATLSVNNSGAVSGNCTFGMNVNEFSVGQQIGFIPHSLKIVLQNDLGVALTSGTVFYSEISVP
jgi:hypothetical protein